MDSSGVLSELVEMSREIGIPENDYVILGEGNTSARIDDQTFAVKASGTTLCGIGPDGFVQVRFEPILKMLELPSATDEQVRDHLLAARVDQTGTARPSVETVLHASMLQLPGVSFIGHTHPTAVNSILCAKGWKDAVGGRLFPDEIVSCGLAPVLIDYTDPGLPLAKEVHNKVRQMTDAVGSAPKAVLMQNHGLIALGGSAREVLGITAMWCKTARILAGTYTFGGPNYFTDDNVSRIHSRPDEVYRMSLIRGQ